MSDATTTSPSDRSDRDTLTAPGIHHPGPGIPQPNRFERIPFAVSGLDVAAGSQGANFNKEKVNLAWRQALSLWTAVAPVSFDAPFAGEEPLLRIQFDSNRQPNIELGTTAGHISRTSSGAPTGSASIHIDCDNDLFVDKFREPVRFPTHIGPFDVIGVLAHEVGHALGLDHPPKDPATGQETETGIMSATKGNGVLRQLFPFDIREVQRLHGAIRLADPVAADLAGTAQLIDASPGVTLQKGSFGLIVFGPMETRALVDVLVPAKGRFASALRLNFTTVTTNVFVNRVETWDGIVPIQGFSASSRCTGGEGLAGRTHLLQLGFLHRPTLANQVLVRLEVVFTKQGGQPQSDFGVLQVHAIGIETLPPPIVVHP